MHFRRLILAFSLLSVLALATPAGATDWSKAFYVPGTPTPSASRVDPVYQEVFQSVSREKLETLLQQTTGYLPVTVGGRTYSITNRYFPEMKAGFRGFWLQYFQMLGIPAQELAYPTRHRVGESNGHNLEAVLPGKSKDSIVIVVHYDSMGRRGREGENPAVDDDMTGMAILMETARILSERRDRLQNTVRFVASDYEEHGGLEGARVYAKYLKELAQREGFRILAAVDNEQSGWNCAKSNDCGPMGAVAESSGLPPVDVYSCSGDGRGYDSSALGDALAQLFATYSSLSVRRGCIGAYSDHYALWEIGVPAVVFSEHNPFENPHFDGNGGDTLDKIDLEYFFRIAQVGVTFAATLAGISPSR